MGLDFEQRHSGRNAGYMFPDNEAGMFADAVLHQLKQAPEYEAKPSVTDEDGLLHCVRDKTFHTVMAEAVAFRKSLETGIFGTFDHLALEAGDPEEKLYEVVPVQSVVEGDVLFDTEGVLSVTVLESVQETKIIYRIAGGAVLARHVPHHLNVSRRIKDTNVK